ncbi:heme exporter protein CcmD [Sphingorhabdus sp.]|jgi:heme exporter protein CcmD|nr:heme exporter protein CcmD [Sphingorhabdus sp.]MDH4398507.1 heme exporter protein CcmD [Sphingorhabdus sp.]
MPHAPFIIASYVIAGVGLTWLVISSYISMRRAEASAAELKDRP